MGGWGGGFEGGRVRWVLVMRRGERVGRAEGVVMPWWRLRLLTAGECFEI